MLLWTAFSQILAPILALLSLGWILDRTCRIDLRTMVKLNINLFVPALIFVQVTGSRVEGRLAFTVIAFTLAVIASMFLLSHLTGWACRYHTSETRSLQLATMFYNSGNYGIPLMTLAYPGSGPLLQVFVILTQNISVFTAGVFLASSEPRRGWSTFLPMLRQASVWAVTAALLVRAFALPVQNYGWIWVPLHYLADGLVPVALLTLGAQLSQTRGAPHWSRLRWALMLRLLAGPVIAALLVPAFGFRGETAAIMILSASFPTAVNTALIAHEFDADADFAAATVFYSTLCSMFTVTGLIALLRGASLHLSG